MSEMANLYVVESPFQLISAMEAKAAFPADKHILFVRYGYVQEVDRVNNEQVTRLLKMTTWDEIIVSPPRKYPIFTFAQIIYKIIKLLKRNIEFDNIFISIYGPTYQRYFPANLAAKTLFLIDDGYNSIEIQRDYLSINNPSNFHEPILKRVVLRLLGLKYMVSQSVNLFTCFNINPVGDQLVIQHSFEYLKNAFSHQQSKTVDKVYLLGGNFIESQYLSKESYLRLLGEIARYYYPLKVIYLPHRREMLENLAEIGSIPGISIERFENPVEVEFLFRGSYPIYIALTVSTALFSMKKIFPETIIKVFKLNTNEVNPLYRERIKEIYSYYQAQHVDIIQLD